MLSLKGCEHWECAEIRAQNFLLNILQLCYRDSTRVDNLSQAWNLNHLALALGDRLMGGKSSQKRGSGLHMWKDANLGKLRSSTWLGIFCLLPFSARHTWKQDPIYQTLPKVHQGHVRAPFHPQIIPLELKLSTLMYPELISWVLKCKLG